MYLPFVKCLIKFDILKWMIFLYLIFVSVRTQLHKSPKWSTLTHAQQLEILHEVASEHTKVEIFT